jgi:hypothetical protein
MSEFSLNRKTRNAGLAGVLTLALAGCGSGATAPKSCVKAQDEIKPHQFLALETGTTKEGTYVYFIFNRIGSVSVRQTLQPGPKHIIIEQPPIHVATIPTALPGIIELKEPGHTEKLMFEAQVNSQTSPLVVQSEYCEGAQQT